MHKLKLIPVLLILTAINSNINAQSTDSETVSTAGGNSTSGTHTIEWTLGEPISGTFTGTSGMVTAGFHQPILLLTDITAKISKPGTLVTYPNPVVDELYIDFKDLETGTYNLSIADAKGLLLSSQQVVIANNIQQFILSLNRYKHGFYILNISNQKGFNQSIKIQKTAQ